MLKEKIKCVYMGKKQKKKGKQKVDEEEEEEEGNYSRQK
jgi:hypothetical protein